MKYLKILLMLLNISKDCIGSYENIGLSDAY